MITAARLKVVWKELQRTGTSKATGDTLCFMYASLLAFEKYSILDYGSISWPKPELFEQLIGETDEQIRDNYLRLRRGCRPLRGGVD